MKTICFLLMALPLAAQAQPDTSGIEIFYTVGFNEMFVHDPGHVFGISFPYTSTGFSGTRTFNGNLQGSFRPEVPMFDYLTFATVFKRNTVYAGVGLNRQLNNDYATFVRVGYDYAFPFRGFFIKPGLDLVFFTRREEQMGYIDNTNQTISALGMISGDTYTGTVSDGEYSYNETLNTQQLQVDYARSSIDVGPRVTLSTPLLWRWMVFSVQTGWLVPVAQTSRLRFEQATNDSSDPTNLLGTAHLPKNGMVGGAYVGVTAAVWWRRAMHP